MDLKLIGIFTKLLIINIKLINIKLYLYWYSLIYFFYRGIKEIALNTNNKKKRSSKLSIITYEDKFIYSVINIKINTIDKIKVDKRLKKIKKKKNLNKEKLL